ncbi:microtubule-associated protein tau isoform X2 [Formica exsecta]|uniref:microtubule-associated protein tau isoform X2 n=1 Tax=Formica exsecta TaxID=72781 RepID=UPI00114387ED|nr:microtubule-associated protein tau isoform X2 [Formica exsecta]
MDSQETANSMAQSAPGHEENMVKPNVLSPPQGFQARPQGPPPSPRNSINNGPIGAPRPGQPLRRLDSRSSLGPSPASGQFVQHRPYGPPRPPGSSFPPRSLQPGQLSPQNPLYPSNQRFVYSPGIRGPPPQGAGGQRPPFAGNQQVYQVQQQQQQQQQQRGSNDPRFQRPDIAPENGPRRPSQESVFPRQLLRNDSLLSLQRQHLSSNEEIKQPTRPRIVIEKMADINETNVDKPESYLQRKKSDVHENGENDDDDDVVMDNEKSLRHNQDGVPEGLVNGSKSPSIPTKPMIRPGTATIEKPSKYHDKISKEFAEDTASIISQSRPSSAVNDDKEERKDEKLFSRPPSSKEIDIVENLTEDFTRDEVNVLLVDDLMNNKTSRPPSGMLPSELIEEIEEIQKPSSPYNDNAFGNIEQSLKTPPKSSDNSRSITPSYLDTPQNAEQAISRTPSRTSDMSRSSTPAHLDAPENAEQNKTPDKSRSSTPAGLEPHGNAEQESKTLIKTPDKSRANTPAELQLLGNAEQESKTPMKTPDKSRANTPAESQLLGNAEQESKTPIKTPDKSRANTPAEPQLLGNVEQESKTPIKTPDKSRANTPAESQLLGNAEQESKAPIKTPDKSRANTPAESQLLGNAEQESKAPIKTPDKSRANTPAGSEPPGNAEQESKTPDKYSRASTPAAQLAPSPNAEKEPHLTPTKVSDKSRSSTPAGIESSDGETSIENPQHDKSGKDTLQVRESSRPASSTLRSPNSAIGKDGKSSPKSPRSPTIPEGQGKLSIAGSVISPRSPEGVKGFDNGEQRSLSSGGSPRLSKSPKSPAKQTEAEKKKKTSFVETTVKKSVEIADTEPILTATSPSKSTAPTTKTPHPQTPAKPDDEKKSPKKKAIQNGSESQANAASTANGVAESPTKRSKESDKRSTAGSPTKSPSKSVKSLPRTPDTPSSTAQEKKKVPMNKVQVGAAPSPNLKTVRSKIGSLDNASYKPGGGKVKIENRKLDFSKAQPKIAAKNDKYMPSGGDKKISQVKLQWNAKPKVGSLENATYKPGGGDKKIETVKLDFKDKAKPKVGSKENAKHIPGGGAVKIPTQKIDIKAESKIGSMDNVKHKPGGGEKKIFNDRDYLRQTSSNVESLNGSGSQSPVPSGAITNSGKNGLPASDENLNQEC